MKYKLFRSRINTIKLKREGSLQVQSENGTLQVKNIEDERAPLADETFGMYWGDLHTDFGQNYNVEFYKKF